MCQKKVKEKTFHPADLWAWIGEHFTRANFSFRETFTYKLIYMVNFHFLINGCCA